MTNNDILRRLRYVFDYDDQEMIDLFKLGEYAVHREDVCNWLKKEEDEDFSEISDRELAIFLNGLIIDKRGKREGATPEPEEFLTNNMILKKLKIALGMQSDEILELLSSEGKNLSKHELSAFFRSPSHKSYRTINDQYLRNFLNALQRKYKNSLGEDDIKK